MPARITRGSVRRVVARLRADPNEQRDVVMDCRDIAESMSPAGKSLGRSRVRSVLIDPSERVKKSETDSTRQRQSRSSSSSSFLSASSSSASAVAAARLKRLLFGSHAAEMDLAAALPGFAGRLAQRLSGVSPEDHHYRQHRQQTMGFDEHEDVLSILRETSPASFAAPHSLAVEENAYALAMGDGEQGVNINDDEVQLANSHENLHVFAEVATEADVKRGFVADAPLSGVAFAVSDALDVRHFMTRSGVDTPVFHHESIKEFPLISWMRHHGAQCVGKITCRSPLAFDEGCVFGAHKPGAVAVRGHACHYTVNCSLLGPPAIACAVGHDVVGFKPTSQTFGTFTEKFRHAAPSMSVGIVARRVDDLLFLWQQYTSAYTADAEQNTPSLAERIKNSLAPESRTADGKTATEGGSPRAGDGDDHGHSQPSDPVMMADGSVERGGEGPAAGTTTTTTTAAPSSTRESRRLRRAKEEQEILDYNPYNYTVKDKGGKMADIDVGWRDYNAHTEAAEGFGAPTMPGFFKRLMRSDASLETPRVELTVGYPVEWIARHAQRMYGTPTEFEHRLTDSVYHRSNMGKHQRLEIVPLAFDFALEDVLRAATVIAHYELARAFDHLGLPASQASADAAAESMECEDGTQPRSTAQSAGDRQSRHNTADAFTGVLEELPQNIVYALRHGQRLTTADYHTALRVRDDVVRAIDEQFADVDAFVVPLLCHPYATNDVRSLRLTIPFQLAGNPMLSVQVEKGLPVFLVGELGHDAALLEDAFSFLQFVRGASPWWWRHKVFGE